MTSFFTVPRMLVLGVLLNSFSLFADAVSFQVLKAQGCPTTDAYKILPHFQWNDAPSGVFDNTFSTWQRWQENALSKQSCSDVRFQLNTWINPRNPVVGGGPDNMFGWSWKQEDSPFAFQAPQCNPHPNCAGLPDLVIQVLAAVDNLQTHLGNGPRAFSPHLDVALFALLEDFTHPELPGIWIVGLAKGSDPAAYDPNGVGGVSYDYPTGNYFSSFSLNQNTAYNTRDPFGSQTEAIVANRWNPNQPLDFLRMRISWDNWVNTINAINAIQCTNCPLKGYSTNPLNYKLRYAGVIAEMVLGDGDDGSQGNPAKDQFAVGVHLQGLGIYRRYPN